MDSGANGWATLRIGGAVPGHGFGHSSRGEFWQRLPQWGFWACSYLSFLERSFSSEGIDPQLMLPDVFAWWSIGILGVLMFLDRVVDFFATAMGSKWFGGTRWGIFGALAGGLIGLFFGIIGSNRTGYRGSSLRVDMGSSSSERSGQIRYRSWLGFWAVDCWKDGCLFHDDRVASLRCGPRRY